MAEVMAAVPQNYEYYRGEDFSFTTNVSPVVDITGWALTFTLRKNYDTLPILITKTVGFGITLTTPIDGEYKVALASADTAALPTGTYLYDIQRTDAGFKTVVQIGSITLLPPVKNI
jgi:hypothetical protein